MKVVDEDDGRTTDDEVVVDVPPPPPAPPVATDFLVIIVVSNLRNCCNDMIRSNSVVGLGDLLDAAAVTVAVVDVVVDLSFILPPPVVTVVAVDEGSAPG